MEAPPIAYQAEVYELRSLNSWSFSVPHTDISLNNTVWAAEAPVNSPQRWLYTWLPAVVAFGSVAAYALWVTTIVPGLAAAFPCLKRNVGAIGKVHHAVLFVYSTVCCAAAAYAMNAQGDFARWDKFVCQPLPPILRTMSFTFTLSKVWEWGDTAILMWKGKSVRTIGFLHLYHHATTFFNFLVVQNFPVEKLGMLLNGFVHSLMYFHFAWRLPKALRPFITAAQIVQLALVTHVWHITPHLCPGMKQWTSRPVFLVPYFFVPVYLLFFLKFFAEQYICGKGGRKPKRS